MSARTALAPVATRRERQVWWLVGRGALYVAAVAGGLVFMVTSGGSARR
jgi:hypothetical protein